MVAKTFASSTAFIFSILVSCASSVAAAIWPASFTKDSTNAVARLVSLVAANNLAMRGKVADDRHEGEIVQKFCHFNPFINQSINQSLSPVAARTFASAFCALLFISFFAAIIAAEH